jgi:hypothetical protein
MIAIPPANAPNVLAVPLTKTTTADASSEGPSKKKVKGILVAAEGDEKKR